jgi:DNA (cytosine-5)-methyltransferase 1
MKRISTLLLGILFPRLRRHNVYCSASGTSEGARQAGFRVLFGLEKDSLAVQAYKKNFPEAMHLEMCAHDVLNMARRNTYGVDPCYMSCPC